MVDFAKMQNNCYYYIYSDALVNPAEDVDNAILGRNGKNTNIEKIKSFDVISSFSKFVFLFIGE